MQETQFAGHALEIVKSDSLGSIYEFDGLVTISGDGLLFEVINGVMSRPDWKRVLSHVTFGAIAGGSANGLCTATGALHPGK
jgi:sphingosine kinase